MKKRMMKYVAVKVEEKGFVKVTKDSGYWIDYKVQEFEYVQEIEDASLFSESKTKEETLSIFDGLVDADKLELVPYEKEVESFTLKDSPL